MNSGHWQVSNGGGTRPVWARSGRELVYISPAGALMRVGVDRTQAWSATTPTLLVKEGYSASEANFFGRTYDIAPDGQRFLMTKEGSSVQAATPPSLIVVQHWDEELKRLVPAQ